MPFQGARSGLKMGSWLPADAVTPWSVRGRPLVGHWELRFGPFIVASSTRARFVTVPAAPAGNHLRFLDNNRRRGSDVGADTGRAGDHRAGRGPGYRQSR